MRDHAALADAVNARIQELGVTEQEVARRAGITVDVLNRIQRGAAKRHSEGTLAALSRALELPDRHLSKIGRRVGTTPEPVPHRKDASPTVPARSATSGLARRGAGAGAVLAACGALLYLLIYAGYAIATDLTAHGTPAGPIGPQDHPVAGVFLVLWYGLLFGLLPAVLVGALGGLIVGAALTLTWRFQGPVRAWLTGTVVLYPVVMIINYAALTLRETRLQFDEYLMFLGVPSMIYLLAAGPLAVWLQREPGGKDAGTTGQAAK